MTGKKQQKWNVKWWMWKWHHSHILVSSKPEISWAEPNVLQVYDAPLKLILGFSSIPQPSVLSVNSRKESDLLIVPKRSHSILCQTQFSLALPLIGPFHWEKRQDEWHKHKHEDNEGKRGLRISNKCRRGFTNGPWGKLWVQDLQRMHQVLLWAGRGLRWIHWTLHFLFFFVLHLRIDVEAWDLPWEKIHSEASGQN